MCQNCKPIFLILMAVSVVQMSNSYSLQKEQGNVSYSLQQLKELLENKDALRALTREQDASISTLTGDVHAILSGLELLCQAVSTHKHNEMDGKGDQSDNDQKDDDRLPTSCLDALKNGQTVSGVYTVQPDSSGDPLEVYCDQKTDNGGWTVFQRRQDGSIDFYRNWEDYKTGFGNLNGEFWLGNDIIHLFMSAKSCYELRVDLGDFYNNKAYAKYSKFMVGPENENYVLTAEGYSGDAGDSMAFHNGQQFSTKDRDNDRWTGSCSLIDKGGWWYNSCHNSNLNGLYNTDKEREDVRNVLWRHWKDQYPLKFSEMKFRELV